MSCLQGQKKTNQCVSESNEDGVLIFDLDGGVPPESRHFLKQKVPIFRCSENIVPFFTTILQNFRMFTQ